MRVQQSKGLQGRVVYLSPAGVEALQDYLAIRGPAITDHVFIHRHRPLSSGYCNQRLRSYGKWCDLHMSAHQLRYSFATLVLNAGLPVLTLQRLLGHQRVETTLRHIRLYDSRVARDYGRAMTGVEAVKHRKSLNPLGPTTLNTLPHTGARILPMPAL